MQTSTVDGQRPSTLGTAPAARIIDGVKIYGTGPAAVRALDAISAEFTAGAFTAIMGPSGSGTGRPSCPAGSSSGWRRRGP